MRRFGAWGLEVALVVGLGAAVAGAGEEDPPPPVKPRYGSRGVFDALFDAKPKPPPKKAVTKSETKSAPKNDPPAKSEKMVDGAVAERRSEETAFLRREAVCDRLMEIALQTNDQELLHRADQLRERAWTAYAQRTAHLPGSKAVFESDEQILDKHLGTSSTAAERTGPVRSYTVTGTDRTSQAAVKEGNP